MNLLNQTCKIERATVTKNTQKQTVKTWSVIGNNVKCNIQYDRTVSGNNLQQSASGINTQGNFLGFFDKGIIVLKGDRVTWTGITLFVKGIPFPVFASGNTVHHYEALLSVEET